MRTVLLVFHLLVALSLSGLILLQSSKGGLGAAFGGGETYHSKRGAERIVFLATIVTASLFLLTSIGLLISP